MADVEIHFPEINYSFPMVFVEGTGHSDSGNSSPRKQNGNILHGEGNIGRTIFNSVAATTLTMLAGMNRTVAYTGIPKYYPSLKIIKKVLLRMMLGRNRQTSWGFLI